MRVAEAASEMLQLLPSLQEEVSRAELVLALARIVGGERSFTRLWRRARRDVATGLSQALSSCRRRLRRSAQASPQMLAALDACNESIACGDLSAAGPLLRSALAMLPVSHLNDVLPLILPACRELLRPDNPALRECLVLSVHVLGESITCVRR
jgi:hypothetical protein